MNNDVELLICVKKYVLQLCTFSFFFLWTIHFWKSLKVCSIWSSILEDEPVSSKFIIFDPTHWWYVLDPSLEIFLNNSFFAVVMLVKDLCFASLSLKTYANFSNSLVKTKTYFALTRAEKTKSGFCSGAIKGRKKHFREKAHHCCVFKKSFGIIFFLSLKKGK